MTVWICRAGLQAQYLNKFIEQKKIFLIGSVGINLTGKTDMQELMKVISHAYPTEPDGSVTTMSVQARAFATKAKVGDWVVVSGPGPEKILNIGEITGKYVYDGTKSELKHSHVISWKHGAWKRESFPDDIIRSVDAFDTFMMFFKLRQGDRLMDIVSKGKPFSKVGAKLEEPKKPINKPEQEPLEETEPVNMDVAEIKEVIAEVRETITYVKKEALAESAAVRKMIVDVQDVISEVRETITEVKKATLLQAQDVKKVIVEVRDALDAAENCCSGDEGSCGNTVYYNYSRCNCNCNDGWYYETPRERRRFRL